ncbi:MAG: cysteine-rich CWC family protein [Chlorobiaceae bacterium]
MTTSIEHTPGGGKTVTCPVCGQPFTCALSSTCWCATRTVPSEVRDYLAGRYETCVCSTCLDQLIEQAGTGESA